MRVRKRPFLRSIFPILCFILIIIIIHTLAMIFDFYGIKVKGKVQIKEREEQVVPSSDHFVQNPQK